MPRPRRARWLTVDLLLRLMLPLRLLVIVAAAAAAAEFGAYTAQQFTARVYDRWLLDAARSVSRRLGADINRQTSLLETTSPV